MDRRTVLKAGFTLALTSHTAVAKGDFNAGNSGIEKLIAEHAVAMADYEAANEAEGIAYQFPGRPAWPCVEVKDIPARSRVSPGWRPERMRADEINEYFASAHRQIEFNMPFNTDRIGMRRKAEAAEDHAATLALLDNRQRAYDDWAVAAGLRAAQQWSSAAADRVNDIENAILDYRCSTIEEATAKCQFAVQNWSSDMNKGDLYKVVRSFLPVDG